MKDDGGPAFPHVAESCGGDIVRKITSGGMSLRDWFAGMVMQGQLSNELITKATVAYFGKDVDGIYETLSRDAYRLADAMLAERKKKATP